MQPTQVVNSAALNRVCVTDCPQGNNISCISCITTNGSGIACYEERDRKSVGERESAREREEGREGERDNEKERERKSVSLSAGRQREQHSCW
jgi:hypothetical protein